MTQSFQWRVRFALQFITMATLLVFCNPAIALRGLGGKEPVRDGGWPDGALAVANLPSRIAYSHFDSHFLNETGCEFFYSGDLAALQKAVDTLAEVRAPAIELVVHDGPATNFMAAPGGAIKLPVDWIFTVWNPAGWYGIYRQGAFGLDVRDFRSDVDPPRIDVYLTRPEIDWKQVKIPAKIRFTDDRAAAQKDGGKTVRGVIYDMATGKTIPSATVELQAGDQQGNWKSVASVTSNAKGEYQVEKAPQGKYRTVVSAKGYASRVLTPRAAWRPGESLDVLLITEVTVRGTVCEDDGKPLPNVEVLVTSATGIDGQNYSLPGDAKATTDAAGKFLIPGLPTGSALFRCTADGYRQLEQSTQQAVRSWKTINTGTKPEDFAVTDSGRPVKLTGEAPVVLRMAVPGTIHAKAAKNAKFVSISDAQGGYRASFERSMLSREVDPGGTAEFTNLAPGRYFVASEARVDWDPRAKIVTVSAGKVTEVDLGSE